MLHLCVFCGSAPGVRPAYAEAARDFGGLLARRGVVLVYGGGHVGLMGAVADGALAAGGRVVGVIPQMMVDRELAHQGLTELHVVADMHQRKALMAARADAFAALPGGCGTLDELFEIITWGQIGLHAKPVGLLNQLGYFDPLLAWLDRAVAEGFVQGKHRSLLVAEVRPERLLAALLPAAVE
jgi:uncharacterized protein (TIGR00730 family)